MSHLLNDSAKNSGSVKLKGNFGANKLSETLEAVGTMAVLCGETRQYWMTAYVLYICQSREWQIYMLFTGAPVYKSTCVAAWFLLARQPLLAAFPLIWFEDYWCLNANRDHKSALLKEAVIWNVRSIGPGVVPGKAHDRVIICSKKSEKKQG